MESSFVVIFIGGAVTAALAMVLIALSRPQARRYRIRRGAVRIPCHEPRVGLTKRGQVVTDLRTSDCSTLATSRPIGC